MAKFFLIKNYDGPGEDRIAFMCPGCEEEHHVSVSGPKAWGFNNDMEKPTLTPSILVRGGWNNYVCHSFVRDGVIQFLNDCTHKLAGQTILLEEINREKLHE